MTNLSRLWIRVLKMAAYLSPSDSRKFKCQTEGTVTFTRHYFIIIH